MKKRLECKITGTVQGVMFRDFVWRKARDLDLVGTVENTPDEAVLVIAEGEEENLKKLIPFLWEGPLLSRMVVDVEDVEEEWGEVTKEFPNFRILY